MIKPTQVPKELRELCKGVSAAWVNSKGQHTECRCSNECPMHANVYVLVGWLAEFFFFHALLRLLDLRVYFLSLFRVAGKQPSCRSLVQVRGRSRRLRRGIQKNILRVRHAVYGDRRHRGSADASAAGQRRLSDVVRH